MDSPPVALAGANANDFLADEKVSRQGMAFEVLRAKVLEGAHDRRQVSIAGEGGGHLDACKLPLGQYLHQPALLQRRLAQEAWQLRDAQPADQTLEDAGIVVEHQPWLWLDPYGLAAASQSPRNWPLPPGERNVHMRNNVLWSLQGFNTSQVAR